MEFSIAAMKRLIQENGDKRVSLPAAEVLGDYLDGWSYEVSRQAVDLAESDGRLTVTGEDIRQAIRNK